MKNYLYLLSTAHSGSTLVAFLVGGHREVATVGEVAGRTDYENYPCSCGAMFTSCPFWKSVAEKLLQRGLDLDLKDFGISIDGRKKFSKWDRVYNHYFTIGILDRGRDLLFAGSKKRKQWIEGRIDRNIALAETIAALLGNKHFLDTTKDLYRLRHLKQKMGPRVKALYLTRDGRGAVYSLINKENMTPDRAIRAWMWSNTNIQKILNNYFSKDEVIRVKYEDLCGDTVNGLNEMFRFIDAEKIGGMNELAFEGLHIIGNRMRKNFSGDIRLDEKWRSQLDNKTLDQFDKLAGKLNRELGYV
jgi:hypothetical protein